MKQRFFAAMVLRKEAVTLTSDAKVKMKGNEIVSVVSDIPFYYGKVGATSLTRAAFKSLCRI